MSGVGNERERESGESERGHLMLEVSRRDDLSQTITLSKHGPTPITPINRPNDLGLA